MGSAFVTGFVVVNKNDDVIGLITHQKIERAARTALAVGIDASIKFIEANKAGNCKYYFVSFLSPLSPNRKPSPTVAVKTANDNANEDMVAFVNQIISISQDS